MKKSNILLLSALILVLAGITFSAVYISNLMSEELKKGDGNIENEVRHVTPFSKLNVKGNLTVYYLQDTVRAFVVEADSNLLEHISTKVQDGVMNISHSRSIRARNLKVHISQEYLDEVRLNGGGRFITEKPVKLNDVFLWANGGARFEIEGIFQVLNMQLNAGSMAELSGQCEEFSVTANAGSTLRAKDFVAQDIDAKATAGSNLEIHAVNILNAKGSAGSNIYYHGDPELKNIQTSSGANLRKR